MGSASGRAGDEQVHVQVRVSAVALKRARERAAREGESLDEVVGLALALYALGLPVADQDSAT